MKINDRDTTPLAVLPRTDINLNSINVISALPIMTGAICHRLPSERFLLRSLSSDVVRIIFTTRKHDRFIFLIYFLEITRAMRARDGKIKWKRK